MATRHWCLTASLALATLAPVPVHAQTIRALVQRGDVVSGLGSVRHVESVELYGDAGWVARLRTGADWAPTRGVLRDGTLGLLEGQVLPAVPGATVLTIGALRADTVGHEVTILTLSGVPNPLDDLGVFVDAVPMLREGDVSTATSFAPNTRLLNFRRIWPNDQDEVLLHASVDEPSLPFEVEEALIVARHDGAGNLVAEEARWRSYDPLPGTTLLLESIDVRPEATSFNGAGQVLTILDAYTVDDDSLVYLDQHLIAREGAGSPLPGLPWAAFTDAALALGEAGEIALRARLATGDASNDEALFLDGALIAREGSAFPLVPGATVAGFGDAPVHVTGDGRLLWYVEWTGPDAGAGWCLDDQLLVRTGRAIGARTIAGLRTGTDDASLDEAGVRFAFVADLDDGTHGAFLLDFDRGARVLCVGDGVEQACPCGNVSSLGAREGCANSSGNGAVLFASGTVDVDAHDLTLTARGVPAGQPGLFLASDDPLAIPFRDGVLCATTNATWLEFGVADAAGVITGTNAVTLAHPSAPGVETIYQLWYRDPVFTPCGSGSNTSAALAVAWQ